MNTSVATNGIIAVISSHPLAPLKLGLRTNVVSSCSSSKDFTLNSFPICYTCSSLFMVWILVCLPWQTQRAGRDELYSPQLCPNILWIYTSKHSPKDRLKQQREASSLIVLLIGPSPTFFISKLSVCACVCNACVCVCVCVYVCAHVCMCMYVCAHVCACLYVCACVCACMHACICECICMCIINKERHVEDNNSHKLFHQQTALHSMHRKTHCYRYTQRDWVTDRPLLPKYGG